jgi:hypothetical protein
MSSSRAVTLACLSVLALAARPTPAAPPPAAWSPAQQRAILDKTKTFRLAPDLARLTPGERRAVDEILAVGRIFQELYEDSRHPQAAAARAQIAKQPRSDAATLYRLFQGPIATTLENKREAFLPVEPETLGKNLYPSGATKDEIEGFLILHPEERERLLDPRTVVRRVTAQALAADLAALAAHPLVSGLQPSLSERLRELAKHPDASRFYAVPYSVAYAEPMTRAFAGLVRAADAVQPDDASSPATCATGRATWSRTTTRAATPPGSQDTSAGSTRRSAPTRPTTTPSSA